MRLQLKPAGCQSHNQIPSSHNPQGINHAQFFRQSSNLCGLGDFPSPVYCCATLAVWCGPHGCTHRNLVVDYWFRPAADCLPGQRALGLQTSGAGRQGARRHPGPWQSIRLVRQKLARQHRIHAVSFGVWLAHDVHRKINRAHDAVAKLYVDQCLGRCAVRVDHFVPAVDQRVSRHACRQSTFVGQYLQPLLLFGIHAKNLSDNFGLLYVQLHLGQAGAVMREHPTCLCQIGAHISCGAGLRQNSLLFESL